MPYLAEAAARAAVGIGVVSGSGSAAGWKFVKEVAVTGFDDGFVLVGARVRVGETGGVLDGETAFVEGVGGEVARGGEALLFVLRGFLRVVAAGEEGDGSPEQCGVGSDPAVLGVGGAGGAR